MVCDMCGSSGNLFYALVEGTQLNVCKNCSKYGKIIKRPVFKKKKQIETPEIVETVVADYSKLIQQSRQKSGMTQKEFASSLSEKESIIHKLESGSFTPSIKMAKKLQRLLKIKLIIVEEESKVPISKKSSGPLTIGDVIKIKK